MEDWLSLRALTHGERPALITGESATTYGQLERAAARTARKLAALGVAAGDRVATTLSPGIAFAELLHALPKLGASLVPLNTRLSDAERRWQLEDSDARLLVEEPPSGEEADPGLRDTFDPDAEHSLIYTSGTSARPRAVSLTHRNHAASAYASAWHLGVDPGDRWLCVLPVFHVGGLAILLRSVVYGTAAVVHESFEADEAARALAAGEATLVSLVPTMLRRLLDAGLEEAPGLRAALLGGGAPPRDLLERSAELGLPVLQTYGMTETASQVATLPAAEALGRPGSAGRPLPGVELAVGAEGEILVRGPMVSPAALAADGWLHTGDRGRVDRDGFLWVEGRLKDVIVSGGENVSCAEVEEALLSHPAVTDAAAVGRPDAEWGEVVCAYVVLSAEVASRDLIEHAGGRLAAYKAPREVYAVSELPRNAAGKLLRRELMPSGTPAPERREKR